jgi:spermidine/putrescine transport system permease protein
MSRRCSKVVTALVLLFLYFPIVILVISSFNESRFGSWGGALSLKWYYKLFQEKEIWHALRNTLIIGTSATLTATTLGTMAALVLYRYKSRLQSAHYGILYAPLFLPDILTGISLLIFFVSLQVQLGLFTIWIAHTTFCLSYVAFVMLTKLHHFDFSVLEAAQDLGASNFQQWRYIAMPLLLPALSASAMLAFTLSIDDFVITYFVTGPATPTLPIYIYGMMKFGTTPLINALSTLLLFATLSIICLTRKALSKV